jgi:hypothetical protein
MINRKKNNKVNLAKRTGNESIIPVEDIAEDFIEIVVTTDKTWVLNSLFQNDDTLEWEITIEKIWLER